MKLSKMQLSQTGYHDVLYSHGSQIQVHVDLSTRMKVKLTMTLLSIKYCYSQVYCIYDAFEHERINQKVARH
jgi:hypothetical protein